MSIFSRKPIFDVIEYEGDNSTFVWKHPREDFNTASQLIVHESQEALFYRNGQALDLFGPGRHTLSTQNIPLLRRIFELPTGGKSPFHCEVYFINKVQQLSIKWGTPSRIEMMDPIDHFPIRLGASGDMSICVEDARRLLVRIVGTERTLDRDGLTELFRGIMATRIKSDIARAMQEEKIGVFDVDMHLDALSERLRLLMRPAFADYGLSLEHFNIYNIQKPEGEANYERLKKLKSEQSLGIQEAEVNKQKELIRQSAESEKMVMEAEALSRKRAMEGYSYQDERAFDVAERVAGNDAVAPLTNAGIGLGMMSGVGLGMGGMVAGLTGQTLQQAVPAPVASAAPATDDIDARIAKLERLKGRIPEEMYNKKLQEILDSI